MNSNQKVDAMKVAVIGHGYWGKNLARVFSQSPDFQLHSVCDSSQKVLAQVSKIYPYCKIVQDYRELSDEIGTVVVVTPTGSHFELAKHFLERGKNVLLTKPFTRTLAEAEELVRIADNKGLTVFVDHTFVFNPAVRKLKEMLPRIGTPQFVMSQRLNLGLFQPDVNVIYDLMPHDLSILSYLFEQPIVRAQTSAFCSAGLPQEDLAHSSFVMEGGLKGLVTVSWLSPFKVRQFFIVGSEGMLSYDDTEVTEKIRLFDRGISVKDLQSPEAAQAYTARISYRSGDLYAPAISGVEALAFELTEFKKALEDQGVREKYNKLNLDVMKSLQVIFDGQVS